MPARSRRFASQTALLSTTSPERSSLPIVTIAAVTTAERLVAERERLPRERGQNLRRDPDGRRHVPARVPKAPVLPLEAPEVCERAPRRAPAGRKERLDHPCGRLRVRAAAARELESAVPVPEGGEEDERAPDRAAADAVGPQRLDDG